MFRWYKRNSVVECITPVGCAVTGATAGAGAGTEAGAGLGADAGTGAGAGAGTLPGLRPRRLRRQGFGIVEGNMFGQNAR